MQLTSLSHREIKSQGQVPSFFEYYHYIQGANELREYTFEKVEQITVTTKEKIGKINKKSNTNR